MIVERVFHYPKAACWSELRALMAAEMQRFSSPHVRSMRLYSDDVGCSAPLAQDLEFDDYGERDRFWIAWSTDEGTAAFRTKYLEMVIRPFESEVWEVVV